VLGNVIKSNPSMAMSVAMLMYLVKVAVLFALMLAFKHTTAFNTKVFASTILLCTLVWTAAEMWAFSTGKVPISLCRAGQHWVWDGLKFSILSPHPLWTDLDQNDASCVLMIEVPGDKKQPAKRVLVMGDAGFYPEYLLQQQYSDLKADILILGHHGSKSSSSSPFLAAVQPKRAVVSAGFLNAYQHPAPVVLARLKEQGVVVDSIITGGTLSYYLNTSDNHMQPLRYRDRLLWLQLENDADGGLLRRQHQAP
jgi:beta-lactamase superfamily II metal-dependent hydrolase